MEGGLTLDSRAGWLTGGDSGPAVVPKQPDKSLLLKAIEHSSELQMPPEDKLSSKQIENIRKWIENGAPDPRAKVQPDKSKDLSDWWSLKPIKRPALPKATGLGTASNSPDSFANIPKAVHPIDAWIEQRLTKEKLKLSKSASAKELVRRLYCDLHGLPPTPEQVQKATANLNEESWSQLIDELLDSPRYGERWARHWLDAVHFADTHGCEHDVKRPHAWPYRDYVIESFNQDKPWPQFVKEQLAADHFYPDQSNLTPALGFISAGPLELSRASTAPVTFDYLDRDDIVSQCMAVFASATANCARCHDHKFDPISQEDYYSLQAIFAGGGKGDREYDSDPAVQRERARLTKNLDTIRSRNEKFLLSNENRPIVKKFETSMGNRPVWIPLDIQSVQAESQAELKQLPDGSWLASGENPQTDIYTINGTGQGIGTGKGADKKLRQVTAIRLDVMSHDSLPMKGPGRCANGNLHLNEIVVTHESSGQTTEVKIATASADWNQSGWTIQHAIDRNEKSAWGIYPEVAKNHFAIFKFASPIKVDEKSRLAIQLKQLHGGSHLIGRFKIYLTDSTSQTIEVLPEKVQQALAMPESKRTRQQQLELATFVLESETRQQLAKLPPTQQVYAWSTHYSHAKKLDQAMAPKTVHVLKRGNIDRPGKVAVPGSLSMAAQLKNRFSESVQGNESLRRAAFAEWVIDRDNPLAWRSIVNRVWAYHFGRGLCDTPNDFGRMGSLPSHPEMLDWLAVWFRDEAKGSFKKLHRLILTSKTWRQSATVRKGHPVHAIALNVDAENKLLWRFSLHKLDAESYRDSILQIAGSLDLTMGGPGVEQFKKSKGPQATPHLDYEAYDWKAPGANRRSIYRVVWRGIADPFMESLDFPDLGLLTAQREKSSSSLQALATFNNDFVLHFSQVLGKRLQRESPTLDSQVERACQLIWLRKPSEEEAQRLIQYAQQHSISALCRVLFNSNEFLFIR